MCCRHLRYYQPNVYHYHSTPWRYRSQRQKNVLNLCMCENHVMKIYGFMQIAKLMFRWGEQQKFSDILKYIQICAGSKYIQIGASNKYIQIYFQMGASNKYIPIYFQICAIRIYIQIYIFRWGRAANEEARVKREARLVEIGDIKNIPVRILSL